MIRGLFSFGKDHVKATEQYVRQSGADEAVRFLKSRAVDGKVSQEDFMEARERLIAQGMSENDALDFLPHNLQLIEMDAKQKHRHIQKTKERIRDIETAQFLVGMQVGGRDALDLNLAADARKAELEDEIERTQKQLHQR